LTTSLFKYNKSTINGYKLCKVICLNLTISYKYSVVIKSYINFLVNAKEEGRKREKERERDIIIIIIIIIIVIVIVVVVVVVVDIFIMHPATVICNNYKMFKKLMT